MRSAGAARNRAPAAPMRPDSSKRIVARPGMASVTAMPGRRNAGRSAARRLGAARSVRQMPGAHRTRGRPGAALAASSVIHATRSSRMGIEQLPRTRFPRISRPARSSEHARPRASQRSRRPVYADQRPAGAGAPEIEGDRPGPPGMVRVEGSQARREEVVSRREQGRRGLRLRARQPRLRRGAVRSRDVVEGRPLDRCSCPLSGRRRPALAAFSKISAPSAASCASTSGLVPFSQVFSTLLRLARMVSVM